MHEVMSFEQWHNAETEYNQEICPYKEFERSAWNAAIRQCVKIVEENQEIIDSLMSLLSHE